MTTQDFFVNTSYPTVNFDKEFEIPERTHNALLPSIHVPFSFNFSDEDKKTILMPPTFSINTFGRILLKQNYTDKDVIYYSGGDRSQLLETIFKNEKTTDFFDRLLMATVYFFVSNPLLQCPRQKFGYLETVKSNLFYSEENKRRFIMAFESAQRQYHILLRFINKLRLRRSVLRIQTDLILNPISESHRNVVAVHHNGNKYLFTIMDITKIIENSILNSAHMVSSPIAVKNPYNNIPFTKSSLYNLYFQIKSRDFILSPAFHNYFLCNFNLKRFKLENEVLIRDEAISRYLSSSCINTLTKEVRAMIKWYNGRCEEGYSMNVNKDYPKEKLVAAMKPYLAHYFKHVFSLDLNAQYYNEYRLEEKLHQFVRRYPLFGCKIRKRIEGTNRWKISYHDAGRIFKRDVNIYKHFDTSHLEYETSSEEDEEDGPRQRPEDFISVYANESAANRIIRHDIAENVITNELVINLTQEQIVDFASPEDARSRSPSYEEAESVLSDDDDSSSESESIFDLRDDFVEEESE
jgi:hypothetical protein